MTPIQRHIVAHQAVKSTTAAARWQSPSDPMYYMDIEPESDKETVYLRVAGEMAFLWAIDKERAAWLVWQLQRIFGLTEEVA